MLLVKQFYICLYTYECVYIREHMLRIHSIWDTHWHLVDSLLNILELGELGI